MKTGMDDGSIKGKDTLDFELHKLQTKGNLHVRACPLGNSGQHKAKSIWATHCLTLRSVKNHIVRKYSTARKPWLQADHISLTQIAHLNNQQILKLGFFVHRPGSQLYQRSRYTRHSEQYCDRFLYYILVFIQKSLHSHFACYFQYYEHEGTPR